MRLTRVTGGLLTETNGYPKGQRMGDPRVPLLEARIRELEACVLEYWHAKDWAAVGAADSTAAKLLPADMKARAALKEGT